MLWTVRQVRAIEGVRKMSVQQIDEFPLQLLICGYWIVLVRGLLLVYFAAVDHRRRSVRQMTVVSVVQRSSLDAAFRYNSLCCSTLSTCTRTTCYSHCPELILSALRPMEASLPRGMHY